MALTKEDLQAIGELIDEKLKPVKADLQGVGALIDEKLDNKLEPIKSDLQEVKQRVDDLEHSHKAIRADIATLNHEIVPKVNAMYDGITGINEKFQRLDNLELKQEEHGDRILALEYAFETK